MTETNTQDFQDQNSNGTNGTSEVVPAEDLARFEEMMKLGVLFGRKKSKTNPKMRPHIHTTRNGVEIFEPSATLDGIERAKFFLKAVAARKGSILLVGTQPAAREFIQMFAAQFRLPYVVERWLGGTLTNFKTISERMKYYTSLKADRAAGRLEKYTKKERLLMDRDLKKMDTMFGGIESMDRLPEALVIIDPTRHETAVREARRLGIPIVALASSDTNPNSITYCIPCNASARTSLGWVLGRIMQGVTEGVEEAARAATAIDVKTSETAQSQ